MGNLVAIVGRPNVGKSTIFNRLTNTRRAIVNEEAGTTRDRQYGKVEWCGNEFSVIDTGGWVVNSDDIFEDEINKQVSIAIEEADVLLFVVDAMTGVTDLDDKVASILRRTTKPVIVVANKINALRNRLDAALQVVKGELDDTSLGVDYFGVIFTDSPISLKVQELCRVMRQIDEVQDIKFLRAEADKKNNPLKFFFEITSIYGVLAYDKEFENI